ncbi:Aquaporin NIP1-2 [Morus notabilis]|uniref:Aquaporin NIP1-2 n=1 Tax=Morus notabilis TaxID=981085 RepID=W9QES6_9ROSA|nr:aquaporin NIP1-1 [Morus notabilis]EXB31120.1 Aquaporin NIP1-2 [Morus notabilis]
MGDISMTSEDHILHVIGGDTPANKETVVSTPVVPLLQKLVAELLATYFFIFAGCTSILVNIDKDKVITFPGIAVVWGLALMVMIYSVGHISGAHLDPAVTIAFATIKRFPWKQVPAYIAVQIAGATLANGTLRLLFNGKHDHFVGTVPSGSDLQAFVVEFIIAFFLMFVVCGVATDNRAIGELAGLAVGSTILLNVLFAGPISGSSMNPARSLGSAIVWNKYTGIWIYLTAPVIGCTCGAWAYSFIRFTEKPVREITKSGSFLKGLGLK